MPHHKKFTFFSRLSSTICLRIVKTSWLSLYRLENYTFGREGKRSKSLILFFSSVGKNRWTRWQRGSDKDLKLHFVCPAMTQWKFPTGALRERSGFIRESLAKPGLCLIVNVKISVEEGTLNPYLHKYPFMSLCKKGFRWKWLANKLPANWVLRVLTPGVPSASEVHQDFIRLWDE